MSTVIVQVGQCGNQIGKEFWQTIDKNVAHLKGHVYVHPDGFLRSVNVDSEPKVLQHLTESKKLSIRKTNIQKGRRGRGTNWALGYHGTKHAEEDSLLESTIEAIRKETEKCSSFSGLVVMHSTSGGTGSGLGSRLVETLRDEYPLSHLMSCVVAPHTSGESPLQHYNSLLCLATLQRHSDAVMWFHNDEILNRLQKRSRSNDPDGGVSFTSMNRHIARCIAGIVLPTDTITPQSGVSIGQEPWEMLRSVSPMPSTKFVHINHINRSKMSWDNLTGLLGQNLQRYNTQGQAYQSLSNLVVARGDSSGSFLQGWNKINAKIKSAYNPVSWNPFPVDCWTASNHSSVTEHLQIIARGARMKYDAKAYLHWYFKFGCEKGDFEEAFSTFDDIVGAYSEAIR